MMSNAELLELQTAIDNAERKRNDAALVLAYYVANGHDYDATEEIEAFKTATAERAAAGQAYIAALRAERLEAAGE